MEDRIKEVVSFILERYLWQFHSRTWDREENINGILGQAGELLTGKTVTMETPKERCFYADAKFFVSEIQVKFPWIAEMNDAEKIDLMEKIKAELLEITITKCLNGEVANPIY